MSYHVLLDLVFYPDLFLGGLAIMGVLTLAQKVRIARRERDAWEDMHGEVGQDFAKLFRQRNEAIGKLDTVRHLLREENEE